MIDSQNHNPSDIIPQQNNFRSRKDCPFDARKL